MIRINNEKFKEMKNPECKILLQIHDELIFEVKNEEAKKYSKLYKMKCLA